MAKIEDLWVIITTSGHSYADTNDPIYIRINEFVKDLPHDQWQPSRTDQYHIDLRKTNISDSVTADDFRIGIRGKNGSVPVIVKS